MVNLSKVNLDSSSSDDDGYSSSRSNSVSEKKVNKKISISSSSDDDDDDSSDNDSTDSSASKKKKKKVSFSSSDSSSDSDSAIYGGGDPHIHHPVAGGHKVSSSCVAPSMAAGLGSVPMFARPAPRGRGRGAGRNIHGQQSQQQKQGQGTPRKSNTKGVGLGNINNNGLLQTLTTTQGCIGQALGNTFTPDVMASKHSGNKKGGKNAGAVKKPQQQQQQQQQQQLLQQKQKPITKDSLNTMIMHEEEENADKKRKKNKNKVIPFRPLFVISITLVEIIVYVIELLKTKSVSNITWGSNPWQWGGIDSNVVIDFGGKYAPYTLRRSEWWRVFTPTFLHVSLPHIVLVLLLQLKVGWSLEKSFGGWRIAAIYVLSAISGNLLSSILMYSQIAAGASGSLFGFLALLFVDLFKAWKRIAKPIPNLIALIFTTVFALFLGFMPGVDNFMHIGGFIAGILAGVVFLPSPLASPKKRKMTIIVVAPILVIYFVILFVLLFAVLGSQEIPEDWCKSCTSINCAEALLGESWCRN